MRTKNTSVKTIISYFKSYTLLIAFILVVSCAPVEEDEQTVEQQASPVPDGSMVNNQAPEDFAFDQFKTVNLTLDTEALRQQLTGEYLHVRIVDDEQNVYLMALLPSSRTLALSISVPLAIPLLTVEYYTEKLDEHGVLMEVVL